MYDPNTGRLLRTFRVLKELAFAVEAYDTHKMVLPMEFPKDKADYEKMLTEMKEVNDNYFAIAQA
ncbi:hypothetical protein D3C71_2239350 [compost metagenome]